MDSGFSNLSDMKARSPVPVAMSNIFLGWWGLMVKSAFLRQDLSIPRERRRLSKSYLPAILSNMISTSAFLSQCSDLYGFISDKDTKIAIKNASEARLYPNIVICCFFKYVFG